MLDIRANSGHKETPLSVKLLWYLSDTQLEHVIRTSVDEAEGRMRILSFITPRCCIFSFLAVLLHVTAVASADPSEYKLKFKIIEVKGNATQIVMNFTYQGTGYANIEAGGSVEGVFFEYDCSFPLLTSPIYPEEKVRPARWIKERKVLGVLSGPSKQPNECKLKVLKMDGSIYLAKPGGVVAYSQQQYAQLSPKLISPQAIEILPLVVTILDAKWETVPGGVEGTGRGNVHDYDSAMAFTFVTDCEGSLALTTAKVVDRGAWRKKGEFLLVVGQGDDGTAGRHCVLHTSLQPKLVFRKDFATGEISTLTQEEYKALRDQRKAEQGQGPAGPQ